MALRTPETTAALMAKLFKDGKKNRARISTKTLLLLAKRSNQPESGFVEALKKELLDVYNIAFFERPKGGYIGLKLNDLDTSASLKAGEVLGNLHLRVLTSHQIRLLKNELFGLPGSGLYPEADSTQKPLPLPCFDGNLYYDSENSADYDLINVARLIVREDNVSYEMTTSWNGKTDNLIFTGNALLNKATGKYISESFNVSSEHDKYYSSIAYMDLELTPTGQGIEVVGTLKFLGSDYRFSGELARSVFNQIYSPTPYPIKRAEEE